MDTFSDIPSIINDTDDITSVTTPRTSGLFTLPSDSLIPSDFIKGITKLHPGKLQKFVP